MSKATKVKIIDADKSEFGKLLDKEKAQSFKLGDVVTGTVINASKSEVRLDIGGVRTGIVRGRELYFDEDKAEKMKVGQEVEATIIELENENGEMELSLKYAGQQKAWEQLRELMAQGIVFPIKIVDANKGGLMVKIGHTKGFLPVSQLTPEHYPRVEGGDKNKILETLKNYAGKEFQVKIIDVDEREGKLIVSEKAAWEEEHKKVVSKYAVGDKITGKVTAVTDFGVFVGFNDNMEGLVHISELAWQRIDSPREIVKVGQEVEAEIINIDGTKIFLSMKKLQEDPWVNVAKKYKIGDKVKGQVLKVNPFGLFVELDDDIHGLAHISELSDKPIGNIEDIAKVGDTLEFMIISIEPENHRLGLSLKALKTGLPKQDKDAKKDGLGKKTQESSGKKVVGKKEDVKAEEEIPAEKRKIKKERVKKKETEKEKTEKSKSLI